MSRKRKLRKGRGCGCLLLLLLVIAALLLFFQGPLFEQAEELLFPRDYEEFVREACAESGMDPGLILAMIRPIMMAICRVRRSPLIMPATAMSTNGWHAGHGMVRWQRRRISRMQRRGVMSSMYTAAMRFIRSCMIKGRWDKRYRGR